MSHEQLGPEFNLETFLKARDVCQKAAAEIISRIEVGMSEKDGQALVKDVFKELAVTKFWHPTKFRMASDTTKTFRDLPDENLKTQDQDLVFIDIGPIIDNHEADFGRTIVLNKANGLLNPNYVNLAKASELIFRETEQYWRQTGATGIKLFEFAQNKTADLGYRLDHRMAGHRLGDFPHQVFSKHKLFEFEQSPVKNIWVLEIHIVDDNSQRGSFYEDIIR
ncbi:MAG: M24 family metallopeptidase [Bdellovibrionota bacterium]